MRLYTGSYAQPDFTLDQPNELGPVVHKWEDGSQQVGMQAVNFSPTP